ncbi:DNA methylase [Nostoc linckia z18]|uniref:site-specific DNA-methyltransferase (cytosine-N(4)-specific) n=2 Tax=Nostoc linckia TaxID=92942 RepID=A0A9Q6ELQ4_NOSLI|nr:PmeII family type II restriction endonuclease [Nostoc linckia]PHK41090.1 DNA methylase [Nostoc linckia z15]PHK45409.1 DNA methylase [Nostoc linckia z16]PHJ60096.1 DNA methylase [Nostoc linckia z1]PHJ63369.1 DNA methylase [Nostoc linckia z3]PHJ70587.1 DNA methylase [Nostoc linckia z2]
MLEAALNITLGSEEILIQELGLVDKDNPQSWKNKLILGDCLEALQKLPSASIDLIVTSPPYADSRKKTYGGIAPDEYTDWFLTIALELKRVLKPEGSFILNIKEKVVDGERHPYVLKLILGMQKQGWLWTEEYIWHKKNSYPGKWSNRFRDSWERCLHFNKQKKFKMYQESVMVPMGDWAKSRLKNLSDTDKRRDTSKVDSGFGKNISNWLERKMAYPTNVLHLATECGNKNHSAAFPKTLPSWFIKLFTDLDDIVLDPFAGSGTSCVAAKELGRNYVGIEIKKEYCELANLNIQTAIVKSQLVKNINQYNNEVLSVVGSDYEIYHDYLVQHVLTPFYDKRFEKLSKLKLKDVIKRKNTYLFKAKNLERAQDFVDSIISAFLSSQEETIFGNLLEGFAINISETLYGGFKSKLNSVDLEFKRNDTYYIVGIKSGTNWGNSDQISKMKDNFKKARQFLIEQAVTSQIVAVNGCMYGKDSNPFKEDIDSEKTYFKYAGQEFWEFISEDPNLYQEMIVPIGEEAKKKDELFKSTLDAKVNEMTFEFMQYFTSNGRIDWIKLVDYVSKKGDFKLEVVSQQMTLELQERDSDLEEPLDLADALDFEE